MGVMPSPGRQRSGLRVRTERLAVYQMSQSEGEAVSLSVCQGLALGLATEFPTWTSRVQVMSEWLRGVLLADGRGMILLLIEVSRNRTCA